MDTHAHTSNRCHSGIADYLTLIHDRGLHLLVFSGDAKLVVEETAENIRQKFGIPIIPFPYMGNMFIAVPENWISEEELESAVHYNNNQVFSGSPVEAGRQMQSR